MQNWNDPFAAFQQSEKETEPEGFNQVELNTPDEQTNTQKEPVLSIVDTNPAAENKVAEKPVFEEKSHTVKPQQEAASSNTLLATSQAPVKVEDKRVINGEGDINQLAPFKYAWAWNYFLNANKNHWTPLDINMTKDVEDYHHRLTVEEKHVYENVSGLFNHVRYSRDAQYRLSRDGKNVCARIANLSSPPSVRRSYAYLDLPTLHRNHRPRPKRNL